ncbi:MAG: methyltransferase domain-containing protein [Anaerolineae bacterium]|nr:methyltransferase domain-containing protein [Anaerolineae bacterium]
MLTPLLILLIAALTLWLPHEISYRWLKGRIVRRQRWDLNICSGTTDGGGVNADIVAHAPLPRFVRVTVSRLPFRDHQFGSVLCSHTLEHVDDPEAFFAELQRVGDRVTLVLPPLWDITAAFNLLEHRWLFLTFRKEHAVPPPYLPLPGARWVQRILGQRIHA